MDTEKFDVLSFLEHTNYPTSDVVVFQDVQSADAYIKAVEQRAELEKNKQSTKELDIVITELEDKIRKSAIVFELKGLAPHIVADLVKETDNEEEASRQNNELISKTIQGIRNSEGVYDHTPVTPETVAAIRKNLKEGEFLKLMEGVAEVNFNATLFDKAIDAGFPGRRANLG